MRTSKFDWSLAIIAVLLSLIGIMNIYSASHTQNAAGLALYQKQIIWVALGLVVMVALAYTNYQIIGHYAFYIYLAAIFLLVLTLVVAKPINNSRRWINLGIMSFQTSEFLKIAFILLLGKYIHFRGADIHYFREIVITGVMLFIPFLLILVQPDLGTGLSLIPIFLIMLFVGGADNAHLGAILAIGLITVSIPVYLTYQEMLGKASQGADVSWLANFLCNPIHLLILSAIMGLIAFGGYLVKFFLNWKSMRLVYLPSIVLSLGMLLSFGVAKYVKPYQKKRILTFFDPELDALGAGYNVIQSKIAVGSGEFLGKGFLQGTQNQLGFLPEKSTDFIFSVLAEEWGFVGSIVVLILFLIIIIKGIKIAYESKDLLGSLFAAGISSLLFYHVMVNIGMAIGILPVTGLLLPFISYGGSNLIVSMAAIGILLNIRMKKFAN